MSDVSTEFFELRPTGVDAWSMQVEPRICGGTGYLHGGCALGSMVGAMQLATGRPLIWATAQYLARVEPGNNVVIEVVKDAEGRALTQASASLRHEDRIIARAMATLGRREVALDAQFATAPEVAPPEDCPLKRAYGGFAGSFSESVEIRTIATEIGSRTTAFWCRIAGGSHGTAPVMAALGDLLPAAMRVALGADLRGASLDNSVRIVEEDTTTEWLLITASIDIFRNGIGTGTIAMFSQAGRLLATAGQSFAVSEFTPDPNAAF